jgi:transposase-like protein
MTDVKNGKGPRRRKRSLSAEEKLQVWLELLSGQTTQRDAAERWGVDPTTIMRIRRVARAGALNALAQSRPGARAAAEDAGLAAARAEIERLAETVKEPIELVVLRGKQRSGW